MEPERPGGREKKMMYSTTLPRSLKDSLEKAVDSLHRRKADWVRASLNLFLELSEKEQENLILDAYKKMETSHLRPFTTTLTEGQLAGLQKVSKKIKRTKADIVRTAIFTLMSRNASDQEKEIKKTLSR